MVVHVVPPTVKAPFLPNGSFVILKAFSCFYCNCWLQTWVICIYFLTTFWLVTVKCLVRRPLRRCVGPRQAPGGISSCTLRGHWCKARKDRSSLVAAVSGKNSSFSHEGLWYWRLSSWEVTWTMSRARLSKIVRDDIVVLLDNYLLHPGRFRIQFKKNAQVSNLSMFGSICSFHS